ncbi:MAG: glycosyltransferase family 2 protein [Clostridia bacterium]
MKLSLCMIVKDEEKTLQRCLDSVKDAVDEIIIVDTGSIDKTKKIALKYTNKLYDFKWVDDFSKARNYSFSKATGDYILWLDADDVLSKANLKKLINLKDSLDISIDIVMANYAVSFEKNRPTFSYYRERIIKNNGNYLWVSPIHEVIITYGNIIYSDFCVYHKKINSLNTKRNLNIFYKMIDENIKLNSRQKYYFARELYYNKDYEKAILLFSEVLEIKDAWIENKISACESLYECYSNLDNEKDAFESLLLSFKYDKPRAKICCLIGNYFFNKNLYNIAIFWYTTATNCVSDEKNGVFFEKDYYDFIPYLNLCVCYYKLNNIKQAKKNNEMAGKVKPKDKKYLYNKTLFDEIV